MIIFFCLKLWFSLHQWPKSTFSYLICKEWRKQCCRILPTLSFHKTEIWEKPVKGTPLWSHGYFFQKRLKNGKLHIPVIFQVTEFWELWENYFSRAIMSKERCWSSLSLHFSDVASLRKQRDSAMLTGCCSGSGWSYMIINILQASTQRLG